MQAPPPPNGFPRIFDPRRFHSGRQQHYGPQHWPAGMQFPVAQNQVYPAQNQFPFPMPQWLNNPANHGPDFIGLHPLSRSAFSTKPTSQTKTPTTIKNLQEAQKLRVLRMSDWFAQNLVQYGSGREGDPINTWQEHRLQWASAPEQVGAIHGLWAWYQTHILGSRNSVVNGEPAVQDQVAKQVITPMNLFIQNRYNDMQVVNPHLQVPPAVEPGYYPIWRRAVPIDHLYAEERNPQIAGFPDFILTTNQRRTQQSSIAIMEVKAFWCYPRQSLMEIFSNSTAEFITGDVAFVHNFNPTPHKILKQVWGEMVFFTCNWAMWANGEHVIFMVRTGVGEMTCSRPVSWSDPLILWAILGFTLASIDAKMDQGLMPHIVGHIHSQWPRHEHLVQPLVQP